MRILENCSSSWPMPEMQSQIISLRQAFSADLDRPFELRQNYIYGSPKRSESLSPDQKSAFLAQEQDPLQPGYNPYPMTPTAIDGTTRAEFVPGQTSIMLSQGQSQYDGQSMDTTHRSMQWDPSRIFEYVLRYSSQLPFMTSELNVLVVNGILHLEVLKYHSLVRPRPLKQLHHLRRTIPHNRFKIHLTSTILNK